MRLPKFVVFERGAYAAWLSCSKSKTKYQQKHLKKLKKLKFLQWNILMDQWEATKDIMDQNIAKNNETKPWNSGPIFPKRHLDIQRINHKNSERSSLKQKLSNISLTIHKNEVLYNSPSPLYLSEIGFPCKCQKGVQFCHQVLPIPKRRRGVGCRPSDRN